MKLEQTFTVDAPLERVWAALIDVERVAPCLPGAEILGRDYDGSYRGSFKVKMGPTTAAYLGKLEMTAIDDTSHTATMSASGQDRRGQGAADAKITSTVAEGDGTTRVDVVTDFTISGRLARFGRGGLIQDVANHLLRDFAARLQAQLAEEGPDGGAPTLPAAERPVDPANADAERSAAPSAPAPADRPRVTAPPPAPHQPAPAAPVGGISLMLSVLWRRIKRAFGR
jgi:carbon monoxide dehydrogenase subunit G